MLTVITATIMTVRSHLRIVYVTKRTSNGRANEQQSNIFFSKSTQFMSHLTPVNTSQVSCSINP